ncbi:hypothetical protein XCCB100_4499 [Xanthomonas campestris pv. campestris]|uniref:Uncharacterized protein n=1 Tax=Xanthomonas campestris pv. campestris (strain B100) TaxID=509169 RepID=A0A1X7QGG8_XANCB|nr:hypothetical protein XCCB100_4499 [Xanthomonas campestris pv. campestris]
MRTASGIADRRAGPQLSWRACASGICFGFGLYRFPNPDSRLPAPQP